MRKNLRLSVILIPLLPFRAEPASCFWSGGIPGEKKQGGQVGIKVAGRETECQKRDGGIRDAKGRSGG